MIDKTHTANVQSLLAQIRQFESQKAVGAGLGVTPANVPAAPDAPKVERPGFGNFVKSAVDSVNDLQQRSRALSTAYERGDDNVPLTDVVIAMQKSSLAFEATLQIRNKVIKAYEDVKNMPV